MVTFCWLYLYRTFACSGLFLQWVISISYVKDLNISSITVSFTANRYICVYSIAYLGLQHIKQHIRLGWELIRFYQYQCHCQFSPSIPYQCSYRFLSSSLSGKKGALHSLLHQKQPFYFFPNLCLHKTVNMNIFNSNILTFNTWNMLNYSLTLIVFILISTLPLSAEVPVELDWPAATLAVVCRRSNTWHSWYLIPCGVDKCFGMLLVFAPLHDFTALHWLYTAEFSSLLVKCSQALDRLLLSMMLPQVWRFESSQRASCRQGNQRIVNKNR